MRVRFNYRDDAHLKMISSYSIHGFANQKQMLFVEEAVNVKNFQHVIQDSVENFAKIRKFFIPWIFHQRAYISTRHFFAAIQHVFLPFLLGSDSESWIFVLKEARSKYKFGSLTKLTNWKPKQFQVPPYSNPAKKLSSAVLKKWIRFFNGESLFVLFVPFSKHRVSF